MLKTLEIIKKCNKDLVDKGGMVKECGWQELLILAHEIMLFCVYLAFTFGVISIAYAGWLMMTGGNNPSQISQAKGIFGKVVIGIIITIVAYLLVQMILRLIGLDPSYSLLDK
jgi:hypothetical protein